jgi:ArsR family transcriptional regulator
MSPAILALDSGDPGEALHPGGRLVYHYIRMNGSIREISPDADAPRHGVPETEHLIELLRTLADPIRLRMVRLLETGPAGGGAGLSVGELAEILKLPQSTVSRHLKTLVDGGLADTRREGTSTFYRLSAAAGQNATRQLRDVARSHLDHDPQAKNDTHRLSAVLRKREAARWGGAESFFGKHAPQWDQLRAKWFGDTFHLEGLLALLDPEWTVADIGTGTGAMLPLLAPHVKEVIAVDPTPAMLKGARARIRELNLANVTVRQGSAEGLPIDAAAADVALLTLVLAYTEDPPAALREVRRILKPGGILLILDLQPHAVEFFREKLNHRWMGFSQAQLAEWLAAAGFVSIRWHPLSPRESRDSATPVPDLFALRAESPA